MNNLKKYLFLLTFSLITTGNYSSILAKDIFIYESNSGSTFIGNKLPEGTENTNVNRLTQKAPTHVFTLDKDLPKDDNLTSFVFGQEGYIRAFNHSLPTLKTEEETEKAKAEKDSPKDKKNGELPQKPEKEEQKEEKPPKPKKTDLSKLSDNSKVIFAPGYDFLFHADHSCPKIKNAYSIKTIKKSETTSYRLAPCPHCFK